MARGGRTKKVKRNRVYHPPHGCLTARLLRMSKFDANGCLIWQGSKSKDGYGRLCFWTPAGPRNKAAHLVACQWWGDRLRHEDGLEYSHTCDCTACILPGHRVWETHAANMARRSLEVPF